MPDLFLGLDIGTSGARAIVIDDEGVVRGECKAAMADFGVNHRAPDVWWQAGRAAVAGALSKVDPGRVKALSVDGTSGTMLAVDKELTPLGDGVMYNDACRDTALIDRIGSAAPDNSAALGANSALARAVALSEIRPAQILHQADWIASQFSGRAVSDENNALKTGFDLMAQAWPDWIAATGIDVSLLPDVVEPGTPIGPVTATAQRAFGLPPDALVVAGTTDGCASFVATGAQQPGAGVTALGSTMTIKLLSDRPISAPQYGIYSHRIFGQWLAGGASNTGGRVLLKYFDADTIAELSGRIDPETDCPLDYYPLAEPGERFPIADPALPPRLEPRPDNDADFLCGLFDGIARIEALAYGRLKELGAPELASVRTVGGGAQNAVWTRLRARRLGVPLIAPASTEAAYGSALLARRGVM
ncbi:Xylulose kinase [Candidatus Rhodobacter oscarellae]|uniref:Xylulose kinase n=1 Tax=Candidatus Rhodobacter oscarellae TaxID=1675527 RepID=A0A0J9E0B5_9RHOB|nr:FGGY-family carbohydrate kinase [Candidatus Rhodobacter lobularis]KMW56160.1 Xylulose kinase [Candidatus Rhodobacter lobularis]